MGEKAGVRREEVIVAGLGVTVLTENEVPTLTTPELHTLSHNRVGNLIASFGRPNGSGGRARAVPLRAHKGVKVSPTAAPANLK